MTRQQLYRRAEGAVVAVVPRLVFVVVAAALLALAIAGGEQPPTMTGTFTPTEPTYEACVAYPDGKTPTMVPCR